jgi:hypothetical protein
MQMSPEHLSRGVAKLGLHAQAGVRVGLAGATASALATTPAGEARWVRVAPVPDGRVWMRADSIGEAQALAERVAMPRLLDRVSWTEQDPDDGAAERTVRADAFEFVAEPPLSTEPWIDAAPPVPEEWWRELRRTHDVIASSGAAGPGRSARMVRRWVRKFAGDRLDTSVVRWVPAHGDLHWANLHGPRLVLSDWEAFSLAPAGFDAALLLTYSLGHAPTAARVRQVFGDALDGPEGHLAQVLAAAEVLSAVDHGFHPHLDEPIRDHLGHLLI